MKRNNRCEQIISEIDACLLEQERELAKIHELVEENAIEGTEEELIYGSVKSGWLNPPH